MNTLKRIFIFGFVPAFLVAASGCVSLSKKHIVCSVKELCVTDEGVSFSIKNTSALDIKGFTVTAELSSGSENSYGYENSSKIQKVFTEENDGFLESEGQKDFFIPFSDFNITAMALESDSAEEESTDESAFYIRTFYVSEVVFTDGSVWKDRYGTWAF